MQVQRRDDSRDAGPDTETNRFFPEMVLTIQLPIVLMISLWTVTVTGGSEMIIGCVPFWLTASTTVAVEWVGAVGPTILTSRNIRGH